LQFRSLELFLRSLISDVDRRIKRGQKRLGLTQDSPDEDIPKVINDSSRGILSSIGILCNKLIDISKGNKSFDLILE
jgi:hypothetical protein